MVTSVRHAIIILWVNSIGWFRCTRIFGNLWFVDKKYLAGGSHVKSFILNFGPQHPSSHGVLRLVLRLEGEVILSVDPHIGFLHRGSEKLMEMRDVRTNVVYIDRLDYTSVLTQTHAYCLAVEALLDGGLVDLTTSMLRTIFDELARILNHLLSIAAHTLDVGSMVPLFWAFEERERIMELFEYVSGARMHAALYFPNQSLVDLLTLDFCVKVLFFLRNCQKAFSEMFVVLYNNRVWKLRLVGIGRLSSELATRWGTSGPILRSTGVPLDLRMLTNLTYGFYPNISMISYLGTTGDCFDRFLIRMRELFESSRLIYTILGEHCYYKYSGTTNIFYSVTTQMNFFIKTRIEVLSKLFSMFEVTGECACGFTYKSVESGKGVFSIGLLITNTKLPYRVYIRSPALQHLALLNILTSGHYFADLVTILGSLDLVFGEIDK